MNASASMEESSSDDGDDDDDDKVFNQSCLTDFFKQPRKRGRPKKANTAFDVVQVETKSKKKKVLESATVDIATTEIVKAKLTRTNWSKGDDRKRLLLAIVDWFQKTGDALDARGIAITHMETFCRIVKIPYNTFQKYLVAFHATRREEESV